MRLTLRTMLAYLDEVLEPADAADIGKKIEESEFAANIVHRTRDVMRRLRLGAPKFSGRGMGLDPNTVAEYLDNTLPDDRVADFEKVCLESDVHLAEVASCHQILALVLDQPADVEAASRQRMYALPEQAEKLAAAAAASATTAPVSDTADLPLSPTEEPEPVAAPRVERRKPEVPEYLRETAETGSWWSAAAIAALAVAFIAVLIMAIGVDEGSWLGQKLGFGTTRSTSQEVAQTPDDDVPAEDSQEPASPDASAAAPDTELQQPDEVTPSTPSTVDAGQADPPLPKSTAAAAAAATATDASHDDDAAGTDKPATAKPKVEDAPAIIGPRPDAATVAKSETARPSVPDPEKMPVAATTAEPDKPAAATPETDAPDVAPIPLTENAGRLVTNGQVLLALDPTKNAWQRVPPLETVFARQRLASLPAYRSSITLVNGVNVELLGDTLAEIEIVDGVPGLNISMGRVVVLPAGKADARLRIRVGARNSVVTFVDPTATMALEVVPTHAPGTDPATAPSGPLFELYVASGKLTWQDLPAGKLEEVAAPTRVSLGANGAAGTSLPDWIREQKLSNSEKIGGEFIVDYLSADRPTMLELAELADHRRGEVRALALTSLCLIGKYEPTVVALNQSNSALHNLWEQLIVDLREGIARSPEHAESIRTALEKHRGEAAKELYRMLWGYTPEQLADGAAAKLVDYLEHSDMDFRSLAFWNLRDISGLSLNYRPDLSIDMRKAAAQKWRQRLASDQIVPKE